MVVSDLHIQSPFDPRYLDLLTFLRKHVGASDPSGLHMVLAGDIFDLMIGSSELFRRQYSVFFELLVTLGREGVQLHYIEGNHDFHIGGLFPKEPLVHVHRESVRLELGGRKFWVGHGDLANPKDRAYLLYRKIIRSAPFTLLARKVPGSWIHQIGTRMSARSRRRGMLLEQRIQSGSVEKMRRIYRSFAVEKLQEGYDFVVLGHCHDLDEMTFQVGDRNGQYMNVGYPPTHRSVVAWASGEAVLKRIPYGV